MTVRHAAAWSMAAQYATFAIQFAANVVISRFFLLPADVGLFSIALAAAMVVAVFQDMGVTRFVSGQKEMRPAAVRSYVSVALAFGWLVAAALALSASAIAGFYGSAGLRNLLGLIAASYLIAPLATVPAALLMRDMNFRALFAVNSGSALLGNGAAVALAWQGFGAASLAWAVLITAVARSAIAMLLRPVWPGRPASREDLRPLLRFSSASFVIAASGAIGQRSQDLLVGRLLGLTATGLFSRAGALAAQLVTLLTSAISTVFYAAFARKRDAGEPLAEPYLHLVACNTALNWAAMVGLALTAKPLILMLYGDRWVEAAPLLRWMALSEILFIAVPLQMDIPILLGRIRTLIWFNLLDTVAAITLLALACLVSLEASALSRIAYACVWWAIYAPFQSRLLGFRMRELALVYLRSAACALAAGLPLMAALTQMPGEAIGFAGLILLSGAGVLFWLAALWLTRHPAREEIRLAAAHLLPVARARPAG
ncbi:MAG: oligosaccharide flippase family protein [Novosphingobium sp.]